MPTSFRESVKLVFFKLDIQIRHGLRQIMERAVITASSLSCQMTSPFVSALSALPPQAVRLSSIAKHKIRMKNRFQKASLIDRQRVHG